MKAISFLLFGLLITQVILLLPEETRNLFFKKYVKEISTLNIGEEYFDVELESISYDKAKIKELMEKYDFPEYYDFIEDTNAAVHIKSQESCGCCWAMASTTSLAYRYHKLGIEVDLSPQHELSCYMPNCEGNIRRDAHLSLIKNGTITEECLPFSSGKEIIEECPTVCKDSNIEYKKYYAKNAYNVNINENNFYDVTAIIMDQLLTKGPVHTSITAYDDFKKYGEDPNCQNNVYSYDGVSGNGGRHSITIVGYGLLNNKYYWLIQNSWGEKWCQTGFGKIEFGQVGIGSITFSEPFIEESESTDIINVRYVNITSGCELEIETDNNLDNWKSQLNIILSHTDKSDEFDYICGVNKLITEDKAKIYCNFEYNNKITNNKGLYKYKSFQSLGKGNKFSLDSSFEGFEFYYHGEDELYSLSKKAYTGINGNNLYHFISEKGSRISFLFVPVGVDKSMENIGTMVNKQNGKLLSNCKKTSIAISDYIVSYCDVDENELNYFYDYSTKNEYKLLLKTYCNKYNSQEIIVYKLDKSKYPVFRIKHFFASYDYEFKYISTLLLADIEGSIPDYEDNKNSFALFFDVESNNKNYTQLINCKIGNPKKIGKNYGIMCSFGININDKIDNIYLHPYYGILQFDYPFEIIINDVMKNEEGFIPFIPSASKYLSQPSLLILLYLLLI